MVCNVVRSGSIVYVVRGCLGIGIREGNREGDVIIVATFGLN